MVSQIGKNSVWEKEWMPTGAGNTPYLAPLSCLPPPPTETPTAQVLRTVSPRGEVYTTAQELL